MWNADTVLIFVVIGSFLFHLPVKDSARLIIMFMLNKLFFLYSGFEEHFLH